MIQQVMEAPKKIVFRDIPVPEMKRTDAKIKIHRIGVCGSDIHVWHGTHPFTSYPITQGHEVSGEIVDLGEDVTNLHVGQRVTIQPQVVCGKCYPCTHGKYNLCEKLKVMGFQTTGTASEFFVCPAEKVTPLPENLSYDEGAMIEPLAVAVHAVRKFGDISGKNVCVLGAGTIGNLVAQVAKGLGASKVMITSHGGKKMEVARECGIDRVIDTHIEDFGETFLAAFGPDKADVIYDCAGTDLTMGQAIQYARKGSTIILVAVFAKMANIDLAVLNDHEIDLNTSMMYRSTDFEIAMELVSKGLVNLKPLISGHFAFKDYENAYHFIDANKASCLKVIIDVSD